MNLKHRNTVAVIHHEVSLNEGTSFLTFKLPQDPNPLKKMMTNTKATTEFVKAVRYIGLLHRKKSK